MRDVCGEDVNNDEMPKKTDGMETRTTPMEFGAFSAL